jgi:hypothetical protein
LQVKAVLKIGLFVFQLPKEMLQKVSVKCNEVMEFLS